MLAEKLRLDQLGSELVAFRIEFSMRCYYKDMSIDVPIVHEGESIDFLNVVWQSQYDDHGVPTGEYTYKVYRENWGTLFYSKNAAEVAHFIISESEMIHNGYILYEGAKSCV